ncbi:CTP_transf_like domain-containing protein [Psidium guajava]|nr:CTP_transf_like domain-containing protein [Psidium guajava]
METKPRAVRFSSSRHSFSPLLCSSWLCSCAPTACPKTRPPPPPTRTLTEAPVPPAAAQLVVDDHSAISYLQKPARESPIAQPRHKRVHSRRLILIQHFPREAASQFKW